jgi:GT2 family glycosyltransferase
MEWSRLQETSILVVIVNYRTPDMVLRCLQSLADERASVPKLRVHVIDNDSGDGSAEAMQHGVEKCSWSAWVRISASDHNPSRQQRGPA